LDVALDCGIREADFWDMTLAELERAILSWQRVNKTQAQEKAAYDYIMSVLIGRSVASYFSSDISIPEMSEVYSHLFQEKAQAKKEEKEQAKTELSALRFKLFVKAHNDKLKKS
jgi:hypothetical protein